MKGEKGGGWSGQEGDLSPPEATRKIPFHALGAHSKSRAFRAEFDIMHKSLAIRARISPLVSLSGHRLDQPHTSAFFLRCVTLCDNASRYILYFAALFVLKLVAYCLIWS